MLQASQSPRVVSILAGGWEGRIESDNLDLSRNFSFSASNEYPATMTSLVFELLATKYPSVSFIHEYPGIVATPLLKTSVGSIAGSVLGFLMKPISISASESGEWNVFLSTSPSFPSQEAAGADSGAKVSEASTGKVGGGSYILKYNGQDATNQKLMAEIRETCSAQTVWDHTVSTFDRIVA